MSVNLLRGGGIIITYGHESVSSQVFKGSNIAYQQPIYSGKSSFISNFLMPAPIFCFDDAVNAFCQGMLPPELRRRILSYLRQDDVVKLARALLPVVEIRLPGLHTCRIGGGERGVNNKIFYFFNFCQKNRCILCKI